MDRKVKEIRVLRSGVFPTGEPVLVLKIIINLNPVSIGVFQVNLADSVHAFGNGEGFSGPVFKMDPLCLEFFEQFIHFSGREAEMGIFFCFRRISPAGNQVEMGIFTDAEPGMAAIVKGFGDGIEANYLLIKGGAGSEVGNV